MGVPYAVSSDLVSAYPAKSLAIATYLDDALAAKTDTAMTQNAQTGTSYSYAIADASKLLSMSNAASNTVLVTKQATVTWVTGTQLRVINLGAGTTTLVADTGVTINNNKALGQYQGGTLIRTASDVWTFQPNGGSKILQVVSVLKQDTFTTTATAYTDVTGLTATITPSSTSSTIIVMVSLSMVNALNQGWARGAILRGSTIVGGGTPSGSRPAGSFFYRQTTASLGDGQNPKHMTFLDSPASISAQTYKVQVAAESGSTVAINRGPMDDNDVTFGARLASSITLMEVAP